MQTKVPAAGGILSGLEIRKAVDSGDIEIDPWDPTHVRHEDRVNPASYDLTLGDEVAVYKAVTALRSADQHISVRRLGENEDGSDLIPDPGGALDVSKENEVRKFRIGPKGWIVKPGIGYLMHTAERIRTGCYVPIIDGKSSIGRLFIFIHVTAGYGDPGFDGQYTLEVASVHPVRVYAGMRFCQMRFHTLVGDAQSYQETGSYKGDAAKGPVPSQSWKMFGGR